MISTLLAMIPAIIAVCIGCFAAIVSYNFLLGLVMKFAWRRLGWRPGILAEDRLAMTAAEGARQYVSKKLEDFPQTYGDMSEADAEMWRSDIARYSRWVIELYAVNLTKDELTV